MNPRYVSQLCFISLSCLMWPNDLTAQEVPPASSLVSPSGKQHVSKGPVELTNDEQRALFLLESLVPQARKLEPSILKTRIITRVADTLWFFNESDSRTLFTEAFRSIDSLKPPDQLAQRREDSSFLNARAITALRGEVLRVVASRDHKLAETLRLSLKQDGQASSASRNRTSDGAISEDDKLAWEAAIAAARNQPAATAQFVRSRLNHGISEELMRGLVVIRRKNRDLADQLFMEVIAFARVNLANAENMLLPGLYVLSSEFPNGSSSARPMPDEAVRAFLSYVIQRLTSQYASNKAAATRRLRSDAELRVLISLMPLFERHLPEQSGLVRARIGVLQSSGEDRSGDRSSSMPDIEKLLHEAEKMVGSDKRDHRLMQVSLIAAREGEFERALDIAERISDLSDRRTQISLVASDASLAFLRDEAWEDAYRWARKIEYMSRRVGAYVGLARKLKAANEPARARVILDEIFEWTNKANVGPQKAAELLTLTTEMATYDADRSFDWLGAAVRGINAADFSPAPPNQRQRERAVRLDTLDFDRPFRTLTKVDYERTLQNAQSLTHKEASLFAQAIVCSQVLSGQNDQVP